MKTIFTSIIDIDNWNADLKYLAPGYSKFICAVIYKYPNEIEAHLEWAFQIYSVLLQDFSLEDHALDLLGTIIEVFDITQISE